MARSRKSPRRTPKSKWSRKVNRRPKSKAKKPRTTLKGKQLATFEHLMSGGTLGTEEE